jgi:hypothetical protein
MVVHQTITPDFEFIFIAVEVQDFKIKFLVKFGKEDSFDCDFRAGLHDEGCLEQRFLQFWPLHLKRRRNTEFFHCIQLFYVFRKLTLL